MTADVGLRLHTHVHTHAHTDTHRSTYTLPNTHKGMSEETNEWNLILKYIFEKLS